MTARYTWPLLPYVEWADTCHNLHMWMQMIGKIILAHTPLVNHFWNVTLHFNARGLTTLALPYGDRCFDIAFDFVDHALCIRTADGASRNIELRPLSVAEFYAELMAALDALDLHCDINTLPCELPKPVRFERESAPAAYDRQAVQKFWHILRQVAFILERFRADFIGKCSPVHFFWGSFDIAVTRFSGRPAATDGMDPLMREAYSHEVSSAGFWPGGPTWSGTYLDGPAFYSYTKPEPTGFAAAPVGPAAAFYDKGLGEFLLHYNEVRNSSDVEGDIMRFLQTTYEAGANLAGWDRAALERPPVTLP